MSDLRSTVQKLLVITALTFAVIGPAVEIGIALKPEALKPKVERVTVFPIDTDDRVLLCGALGAPDGVYENGSFASSSDACDDYDAWAWVHDQIWVFYVVPLAILLVLDVLANGLRKAFWTLLGNGVVFGIAAAASYTLAALSDADCVVHGAVLLWVTIYFLSHQMKVLLGIWTLASIILLAGGAAMCARILHSEEEVRYGELHGFLAILVLVASDVVAAAYRKPQEEAGEDPFRSMQDLNQVKVQF